MNILFICMANIHRSRTAEYICQIKYPSHTFRSAGLSPKECLRNGGRFCSESLLAWADLVYVMEDIHEKLLLQRATIDVSEKLRVLGVPDEYLFMQSELISLISSKLSTEKWND